MFIPRARRTGRARRRPARGPAESGAATRDRLQQESNFANGVPHRFRLLLITLFVASDLQRARERVARRTADHRPPPPPLSDQNPPPAPPSSRFFYDDYSALRL